MVLTKVDPVYSSEARNAFNRFNSQSYSTNKIQIAKDTLDSERTLLVFSQFADAAEAIKYMDKLKHGGANTRFHGCLHRNILFILFQTVILKF